MSLKWDEFQEHLQQTSLQAVGIELARRVLLEAMEQEADDVCGGRKGCDLTSERRASRHGYVSCSVSYGAARMELERPRVRANGKEVAYSTRFRSQFPRQIDHGFHAIPIADSTVNRSQIPGDSESEALPLGITG